MAISVETGKAAPGAAAARPERREAEARQDRWMSELERAMLGMMANKPAEPSAQARATGSEGGRWASLGPATFVQPGREAGGDAAAPSRAPHHWQERDALERDSLPELASVQRARHGVAEQGAGTGAGLQEQGASIAGAAQRASSSEAQGALGAASGAGAPAAGHADAVPGTSDAIVPASDDPTLVLLPPVSQSAVASIASAIAAAEADGPGAARVGGTAAGALAPQPFHLSRDMAPASAQAQPEAPAPEGAEIAESGLAGADGDAGAAPAFEKRALHVFLAPDGVHAWLRDADLQARQLRAVVQALAAEVATTGKTLAGLTVNGKPVDLRLMPGAAADDREDLLSTDDGAEFAATPTYPQPSAPKGNRAP